jgi:hypothetical protein
VDEYECLVDDELQILLHLTGKADGAPAGIVSVDEVRVDAALSPDVFTFVSPTGARIVDGHLISCAPVPEDRAADPTHPGWAKLVTWHNQAARVVRHTRACSGTGIGG